MIRHLTTSDEATKTQITKIFKTYSIRVSSTRELIPYVADLLKSLFDTLYALKNKTFPNDFVDIVAKIFTTSGLKFNEIFSSVLEQIQTIRLQDTISSGF